MARLVAVLALLSPLAAAAEVETTAAVTAYYYAMRDQPDFGVGVATLDHGALHFEARYNYEVRNAGSAFVGWTFAGGDAVTFQITPIVGAMFGAARGVVPGVEASVGWRSLDAYIEAEYVNDRAQPGTSYTYAWSELGWRPRDWLRVGLVGQRTQAVDTGREIDRGLFAQATYHRVTLGVYAFNPDSSARYVIASFGLSF